MEIVELNATVSDITFKFRKGTSDYKQAHSINGKAIVNNKVLNCIFRRTVDRS